VPGGDLPWGTTAEDEIEFVLADARVRAHELIDESIAKAEELLKRRRVSDAAPVDALREDVARIAEDVRGIHARLDRIEALLRTPRTSTELAPTGFAPTGAGAALGTPPSRPAAHRPDEHRPAELGQTAAQESRSGGPIQPLHERDAPPPSPWPTPPVAQPPARPATPPSVATQRSPEPGGRGPIAPLQETSTGTLPTLTEQSATTSDGPLNGTANPYQDMNVPASAVPPTVSRTRSRAEVTSGPAAPSSLSSWEAATLTHARNGVLHAVAPAGDLAPTTVGEPVGRVVVFFRPSAGAVILRVAPVVGFQGLMRLQRALTDLVEVREAGVEGYARGEARLRLQLAAELDPERLAERLGEALGVGVHVVDISAADRTVQLSFA
jgi:hypothetical protein